MNSTRFLIFLLCLFLYACGAPSETLTAARQQALIGGLDDDDDRAVVLIHIETADGMEGLCTGTVIGRRTVLSAAHCLAPQVVGRDAVFSIFLGPDFRDGNARNTPGLTLEVERTEFDSQFDTNRLNRGHDIGAFFTKTPVEVPPVVLGKEPLPASLSDIRIVGYGLSSATDIEGTTAGRRRQARVPLWGVRSTFIDVGTAALGPCLGDSGGPAFVRQDAGSAEHLVGIVSYSPQACDGGAMLTRVAAYLPLIDGWLASQDEPRPEPAAGCTMAGKQSRGIGGIRLLPFTLLGFALLVLWRKYRTRLRAARPPVRTFAHYDTEPGEPCAQAEGASRFPQGPSDLKVSFHPCVGNLDLQWSP